MKRHPLALMVVALAVNVSVFAQSPGAIDPNSPRSVLGGLVDALNSKNTRRLTSFIREYVLANVTPERRAQRWMELATQGAPFKIARNLTPTADEIDAIVVDKNGARIAMRLPFESTPRIMLKGLQLSPAYVLEGPAANLAAWKDLRSLANMIASRSSSPGMGVAVIRNGIAQVAVVGVRKIQTSTPVLPDDVWSIGSIGKPICSSVIGALIEKGKLTWDEPLYKALPGMPMDSGFQRVTLEQIMRHRGGIPADLGFRMAEVRQITGNAKTPTEIRERYIRNILSRKPIIPPGTSFAYSNAGYALLSYIAERVMGRPYEVLVRELVYKPLGLTHSYINAANLPIERPLGHFTRENGLVPGDMAGPMEFMFAGAGGGMFMSVGDLAKFGNAHLMGLRGHDGFLKAATIQRLHQGLPESPGGGRLYACGWGIETMPGIASFQGHNGSNGTMRAELAIFPTAGLVVAAVVNRGGEDDPSPGLQAVLAIAGRYAAK